ncbi:MAG: glycosyltransferase [Pseudomonadota bacterium]
MTGAGDRIVMVADSAFARGGATSLVRRAIRALRARGRAVTLLCGELGDEAQDPMGPLHACGAEVVTLGQGRLRSKGALTAARQGLWNVQAQDMVARWVAAHDTPRTLYHLHGWAQILSPAAFAALAPVAPRTVLHAHDFFLACPNGVYMDFPRQEVCRRAPLSGACLSTQCDKRSAAQKGWRLLRHRHVRRALSAVPWGAVAMIHPAMAEPLRRGGVTIPLHVVLNPAAPFATARIKAERNRALAFVGRLDPEKGAADLAVAAAELGLDVIFIGEGPDADRIRHVLPRAEMTGWQPRSEIGAFLTQARGLVMPSRLPEPFGLVAAEASLSGLPVILPQISLLSAAMTEADLGVSYAHQDPSALGAALARLRDMPDDSVARMSRRGASGAHRLAQSEAEWIDGLEGLYRDVLARAQGVEAA